MHFGGIDLPGERERYRGGAGSAPEVEDPGILPHERFDQPAKALPVDVDPADLPFHQRLVGADLLRIPAALVVLYVLGSRACAYQVGESRAIRFTKLGFQFPAPYSGIAMMPKLVPRHQTSGRPAWPATTERAKGTEGGQRPARAGCSPGGACT